MNIFNSFSEQLNAAIIAQFPQVQDLSKVTLEPPRDATHGDLSTNAAMVLAKGLGLNPRLFAESLKPKLEALPMVHSVEIAGPGFINLKLHTSLFHEVLEAAITPQFGRSNMGAGEKINVEYVSANPTGPMHVGHGRGAVFGDALATLLDYAGYAVTREYYINDAGAQVEVLARSAYLRYKEALGEDITIPEGLYPGDYLKAAGVALVDKFGTTLNNTHEDNWLNHCKTTAISAMMEMIRDDLAKLNVKHDVFFSENSLHAPHDHVKDMIEALRKDGHIYEGVLPKPKGANDDEWEPREQTLFRATDFGDDVDRPLLKSNGSYTYFASDIAYHRNKFERGFKTQIDVWGADHGGYIKRVASALKAVTHNQAVLDVKICQLVKLLRDGEPVKMSKRSGDFVTLAEVVEEVGRDAVRFMMLFRKNDATLDFDLAKVVEQSKENPVFYVHYAHARCASVLRTQELDLKAKINFALLKDEAEIALMKFIAQFPRVVEQAATAHEPHRIAFYVHDLANLLNSYWARGNDDKNLRIIIQNEPQLTLARLSLIYAVKTVLKSALSILGVDALEELR